MADNVEAIQKSIKWYFIIGGLLMSQALTLFTTPVVYLYFDRLRHWWERVRGVERSRPEPVGAEG